MGVKLDGTSGYLELADKVLTTLTGSIMAFSAGQPAGGNPAHVVCQAELTTDRFTGLWLENDFSTKYYTLRNLGGGPSAVNTNGIVPNKTQYRINVGTRNGTNSGRRYYGDNVSGTENTTVVTNDLANHNVFTVGAQHFNNLAARHFLDGDVAEVHVYENYVLTPQDITDVLAGTKKPEQLTGWKDGWTLETYQPSGNYLSITGTRTLVAFGGVSAGTVTHPVNRAASSFAGAITLDNLAPTGSYITSNSNFTGTITLDNVAPAGIFSAAQGTINGEALKNYSSGAPLVLANVTIPRVAFLRFSDFANVLELANQVTDNNGFLPAVTNPALQQGVKYLRLLSDATGANLGIAAYTAT